MPPTHTVSTGTSWALWSPLGDWAGGGGGGALGSSTGGASTGASARWFVGCRGSVRRPCATVLARRSSVRRPATLAVPHLGGVASGLRARRELDRPGFAALLVRGRRGGRGRDRRGGQAGRQLLLAGAQLLGQLGVAAGEDVRLRQGTVEAVGGLVQQALLRGPVLVQLVEQGTLVGLRLLGGGLRRFEVPATGDRLLLGRRQRVDGVEHRVERHARQDQPLAHLIEVAAQQRHRAAIRR